MQIHHIQITVNCSNQSARKLITKNGGGKNGYFENDYILGLRCMGLEFDQLSAKQNGTCLLREFQWFHTDCKYQVFHRKLIWMAHHSYRFNT